MTEVGQESHAERMDCAEEGAVECVLHFLSQMFLEQGLPRTLLHFVRRTIGESDDDQLWQNFRGVPRTRDRHTALRDCSGVCRTGRGDYRTIAIQFASKTSARGFIARLHHISHSSFSSTRAGCVSAHLSSIMSLSIANVASGYGALYPNAGRISPFIPKTPVRCISARSAKTPVCGARSITDNCGATFLTASETMLAFTSAAPSSRMASA